jgi:hypothetical protein
VTDPLLRRVERAAVVACLLMAAIALIGWGWRMAAAVIGGGLISAVSYAGLAAGVTALTTAAGRVGAARPAAGQAGEGERAPGAEQARAGAKTLAKVVLRYALLGLLAYVMIARLRLHPVGLLAGVSSVVIAVGAEALRILVKKS